jgi:hypothetical protein
LCQAYVDDAIGDEVFRGNVAFDQTLSRGPAGTVITPLPFATPTDAGD